MFLCTYIYLCIYTFYLYVHIYVYKYLYSLYVQESISYNIKLTTVTFVFDGKLPVGEAVLTCKFKGTCIYICINIYMHIYIFIYIFIDRYPYYTLIHDILCILRYLEWRYERFQYFQLFDANVYMYVYTYIYVHTRIYIYIYIYVKVS
jgi:hypothetical protein